MATLKAGNNLQGVQTMKKVFVQGGG